MMFLRVGDMMLDLLIRSLWQIHRVKQTLQVNSLDGLTDIRIFKIIEL